jgi:exosome complex RNA-binding protein Csl4
VVKANCSNCRKPLIKKDKDLYCTECELAVRRKLAKDYDEPPQ